MINFLWRDIPPQSLPFYTPFIFYYRHIKTEQQPTYSEDERWKADANNIRIWIVQKLFWINPKFQPDERDFRPYKQAGEC